MSALLALAAALLVAPSCPPALSRLSRLTAPAETEVVVDLPVGRWALPAAAGAALGLALALGVGGVLGIALAAPVGVGVAFGARALLARGSVVESDPLLLAGGWDLLAACLRSGLPVALAVRSVAEYLPGPVAVELAVVADRLALGADAHTAWQVPEASPVHKLARAAARSAHSGASLAAVAAGAAADVRGAARDLASARGQRAGVLITGPLGLCFLPAFLALGVAPVVIGLASGLAVHW